MHIVCVCHVYSGIAVSQFVEDEALLKVTAVATCSNCKCDPGSAISETSCLCVALTLFSRRSAVVALVLMVASSYATSVYLYEMYTWDP